MSFTLSHMFHRVMLLPILLCVSVGTAVAFVSTPILCEGGEHGMQIHIPVNEFARSVLYPTTHLFSHPF